MTHPPHSHDQRDRVKSLLESIIALPPLERPAALHAAAPNDPDLHRELLELARASDQAESAFLSPLINRPAIAALPPGLDSDHLGPYRLVRLLGRGAMGAVYEGLQESPLARRVAVKILSSFMDPTLLASRFAFERNALERLDHPGIAKILDAGITPWGHPYLVMELIDGMPLSEYCHARNLSLLDRLRLVASIAEAIHHAHSRGILHRDLKPQNILVTNIDGTHVAKIIDFGVAKLLVDHADVPATQTSTIAGQIFGTPGYMAPEQRTPAPSGVDARVDVFALGVVLYELITGVLPGDSTPRIPPSRKQPRPPSENSSLLGGLDELDCIVLKSIELDRELRYPSAQHLADDLHRLIDGLPIAARPPSTLYYARKFAARHRASVMLAIIAVGLLIAAATATSIALIRSQRDRAAIESQQLQTDAARRQADTLSTVLTSILSSVDPALDGPNVPLRTVLDRASRQALNSVSDAPAAAAKLRLTLAKTYESLGQFATALDLLAPALAASSWLDPSLRIELLLAQARSHVGMSRPSQALESLELAQATAAATPSAEQTWAIDINRANALQLLGRRQEARDIYESLLSQANDPSQNTPPTDAARVLINSGVLLHQMGERDAGEARVLQGKAAITQALDEDHPLAVTAAHNYAILRMARGDRAGAIEKFVPVISKWTQIAGPLHVNTLNAKLQLADLYRRDEQFEESAAILRDLPDQFDAALGLEHLLSIGAVQSAAELSAARDDWPQALTRMREAVRRYETFRTDNDPGTWYARALLLEYQRRAQAAGVTLDIPPDRRDWQAQLSALLTAAQARFGPEDRYVKAIGRLATNAATPAQSP
jgi:eukaryotic-like serine/threonine-protein kinase